MWQDCQKTNSIFLCSKWVSQINYYQREPKKVISEKIPFRFSGISMVGLFRNSPIKVDINWLSWLKF